MTAARAKAQKAAPAPTPAAPQTANPAQPMRLPRPIIESGPAVRLGGDPLPETTRTPLEASFGADLSPVRVHSDSQSAAAAQNMDARAFAYGSHIFVGPNASAHDVPLMAHETAHVLQQSARPAVRLSSTDNSPSYEVEANAASAAVMRGETFTVQQQTDGTRPQFNGGGGIIGRVMNAIASLVRNIPGYMLVSFIIGRDIVANRPVERNAVNLVGAIMGLVPGGNAMFENLQQSGALQRAFEWFSTEFARLNFTWDYIRGLFTRFTDSLGFSDIFNPGGVINRLREVFGEPVRRLREFAGNAVMKVLEFIFEGVMGAGGAQIIAILRRARSTFELIIRDPLRFIGNLIQALRGGFNAFKANIVTHLQAGLIGWLTGALGGAGITLPARFDARGILSLVLQILGLTYQNLRERLVRLIGEPRVRLLEGAFEFIRVIVTQGLAAAWQKIVEFAGNLTDMVIGGIRDFVVQTIVQQAIVRLISFFNPAGAIIQAILAIYNAVQWFIQRIQQIMQLVNAVVESIANIAAGNLSAAITYVEQSMARALPVIISFLAGLLGLNRIADQVKDVIRRIRAVINRALDRVFDFLATRIRSFAGRGGDQDPQLRLQRGLADGTAAVNRLGGSRIGIAVMRPVLAAIRIRHRLQVLEPVQRGNRWAVRGVANPEGEQPTNKEAEVVPAAGTAGAGGAGGSDLSISFNAGGETHRLYVMTTGGRPALMLNPPPPLDVPTYLSRIGTRIGALPPTDPLKANLTTLLNTANTIVGTTNPQLVAALGSQPRPAANPTRIQAQMQRLVDALRQLLDMASHGIHRGTQSDPIPFVWYKATPRYPNITLTIGGQAVSFSASRGGRIPVPPASRFARLDQTGGSVVIGLAAVNQPENMQSSAKKLHKLQPGGSEAARGTGELELFKGLLAHYGFNWNPYAPDHAHDLAFGGYDQVDNLWPLPSTANRAANASYYQRVVLWVGSNIEIKTVTELSQKYFIIKRIE